MQGFSCDLTGQVRCTAARGATQAPPFVNRVAVTPDGRRAVSASFDNTLKVWDIPAMLNAGLASGACPATFHVDGPLTAWDLTPAGRNNGAAGASGRVHFLRLEG